MNIPVPVIEQPPPGVTAFQGARKWLYKNLKALDDCAAQNNCDHCPLRAICTRCYDKAIDSFDRILKRDEYHV